MQKPDQTSIESLAESLKAPKSRRSLLRGAVFGAAGATGLAVAGTAFLPRSAAHAAGVKAATCQTDDVQTILNIAATAEQLAVTFYTYGIEAAGELGITGQNYNYLTAAVVEEQLHLNLLVAAGAKPLTGTFSFPHGEKTFDYQDKFVATLDQLETAFESAYLAAIRDFVNLQQPDLAVLAGQIVTVEAEHRALGRSISSSIATADNWAFTPVYVTSVADAAQVLAGEGYLSPSGSNSFSYKPAPLNLNKDVTQRKPFVKPC